jgi:hypothetical protein
MATAAVGVNHHRVRAFERTGGVGPAVRVNDRADARHAVEALLEQERAGTEFVHARRMTRTSRDDDDLLVGGRGNRDRAQQYSAND